MRYRSYALDIAALVSLFLFSLFFAAKFVNFSTAHPIEDAAILMRYAEHFATGDGIVWNIGEAPVDGATDFLFMIMVGLLVKTGLSLEFATRFIGFSSHILTIGIIYLSLRKLFNAPLLIAFGSGVFFIVGFGFYYVIAYFGTTFFALSACISFFMLLTLIQNGEDRKISFFFAVSSLITGLIRPEGVFLTFFMLLAMIFIKGLKGSRQTIIYYFGVFLLIGGVYLLWRWQYFGYPLPNPYYKKGGGMVYIDSLNASYWNTVVLCMPLLPVFIAGLFFKKTFRKTIGFLLPIVGFASIFILISNSMNTQARFQYVLLPIALMVWWPLTQGIRDRVMIAKGNSLNLLRSIVYSLVVAVFLFAIYYSYKVANVRYYNDGRYVVAKMLFEYKDNDLKLATSEAGLLPLYSQFRSLDTWGLNDQWIAHHGGITGHYLKDFNPHIIMFHAYFSPGASSENGEKEWSEMVNLLNNYAKENGYILAASFGDNPYDTDYYYVRSDFPESAEIVRRIREIEYYSGISGRKFTNYAP